MPPASSSPIICSSWRCYAGAYDPKGSSSKNADYDRALSLLGRQTGCSEANDDSIVSSQHQVDHDDLDQGRDGAAGDQIGHGRSTCVEFMSQPRW